jgi:hypothetical protein
VADPQTVESPSVTWATADHASCTRHRTRALSCGQFEGLLRRAGGHCEICGEPGRPEVKGCCLNIDHEHFLGDWAVRGLLCYTCNLGLRSDRRMPPDPRIVRYIANAWYVQELARLGLTTEMPAEPGLGSHVVTFTRTYIRFDVADRSDWITLAASATHRKSWRELWRRSGPCHLRVVESRSELSPFDRRQIQPWVIGRPPRADRPPPETASRPGRAELEKRINLALELASQDGSLFGAAITAALTGSAGHQEASA